MMMMWGPWLGLMISVSVSLAYDLSDHDKYQEYCLRTNSESFEASCLKNEVIVMNSAVYGRMRIGRCLRAEGNLSAALGNGPNILGCSANVLSLLDRRCLGKSRCELRGTDDELILQQPCLAALKSYLEADYECATVITEDRSCTITVSSSPLHIMHSTSISSQSKPLTCGSKSQPWILEAPGGQQINIMLIDFTVISADQTREYSTTSNRHQLGYVFERSVARNVSIDRGGDERKRIVYTSRSNTVQIVILESLRDDDQSNEGFVPTFLLGFIAVGCTDLVPPEDTWLKRTGNELVVGCYSSRNVWYLRCTENQWAGTIGNCTRDSVQKFNNDAQPDEAVALQNSNYYQTLAIVGVALLGFLLCAVIICVGAVCWRRYYAQQYKYGPHGDEKNSFVLEDRRTKRNLELVQVAM